MDKIRREMLERIQAFRPMDDTFMVQMFSDDPAFAQEIIRIILGIPTLTVTEITVQHRIDLQSACARSVCLDVYARDADGKAYDIEIQRDDRGAEPKRARYISAAMDAGLLKPGHGFSELPEAYVIFITEDDVFGDGRSVYSFDRFDSGNGRKLNDGSHIVYANGQYRGEDLIGLLMHDFMCADPSEMRLPFMAAKTAHLKKTPEGVTRMCRIMEEFAEIYAKEYAKDVTKNNAITMIKAGKLSHEDISMYLDIPMEEVTALAKSLS